MRRKIDLILILLLVLALLTACQAARPSADPAQTESVPARTVPADSARPDTEPAGTSAPDETDAAADAGTEALPASSAETEPASETETPATEETSAPPDTAATEETALIDLEPGRAWRSGMEIEPGQEGLVREFVFDGDGTFAFRCGEPFSEFIYWACGPWVLEGDELRLTARVAEEGWIPINGAEPFEAVYGVERSDDSLILTLRSEQGLAIDEPGVPVVYRIYLPEE